MLPLEAHTVLGCPLSNSFQADYLQGNMSFLVPQKQELNKWKVVLKMERHRNEGEKIYIYLLDNVFIFCCNSQ